MIDGLVRRFYTELWNEWDDAAVETVLGPDFRFRGSLGAVTQGLEGWRGYRDSVRAASADFHNEIVDLVVADNRAAVRLEYSGTHTGSLLGLDATGRRFTYAGAAFFAASDDHLAEAWVLGDLKGLETQLREPR